MRTYANSTEDKMKIRKCDDCDQKIPKERLEAIPDTLYCVKCAVKHPPKPPEAELICDRASATGRNGFAPAD